MMESKQFNDNHVLKFAPGEELKSTLTAYVREKEIRAGFFIAFGAFCRVRFMYFDVKAMEYRPHELDRQVEVVSLTGNVARKDGEPALHLHGAVADGRSETYSGHIDGAVVRPTLELFLTDLGGELVRETDPDTGLALLRLDGP
jgi:predicted DNA-binding protein with PD1-like motif